jgi:hypothetical protein
VCVTRLTCALISCWISSVMQLLSYLLFPFDDWPVAFLLLLAPYGLITRWWHNLGYHTLLIMCAWCICLYMNKTIWFVHDAWYTSLQLLEIVCWCRGFASGGLLDLPCSSLWLVILGLVQWWVWTGWTALAVLLVLAVLGVLGDLPCCLSMDETNG